jgi:UDP-2,3-diacylglucosamine pyrophosphatase LpxH
MPHRKLRTHYRAVFISDLHLGFRGSQAANLASFLKSIECEYLFLVGDVFDLWNFQNWTKDCTAVIRRILKMMKNGTKVIYTIGNHDDSIRQFIPLTFGDEIQVVDEYEYTALNGSRFLVIHGDIFDFVARWLAMVGAHIYDVLLFVNHWVHKIRMLVGFKRYWSLSAFLKRRTKKALDVVKNFRSAVLHYARSKNCDGVVTGHIHTAVMEQVDNMLYVNCGDWVESLTAFVEHTNGQFELIHWHDMTTVGIEDVT